MGELWHEDMTLGGYYVRFSEETSKPPLVLVHGFTGSGAEWDSIVAHLREDRAYVLPDLLSHGRSATHAGMFSYRMDTVAYALRTLIAKHDSHLLGYSMGGRLALYTALEHGERWKSLILESASPGLRTKAERTARRAADHALADRIERDGIETFVEEWENLPLFASQKQLPDEVRAHQRATRLQNDPRGLANTLRGMGTGEQPSLWRRLGRWKKPALLIAGELDEKFTRIAHEMAAKMPNARVQIIPNAGHNTHLEQPAAFAEAVQTFLDEVEANDDGDI